MKCRVISFVFLGWLATTALGDPFWVAYEGNDYPTHQGWFRNTYGPAATVSLDSGILTIDSLASIETADTFEMQGLSIAPDTGETFVLEWAVRVVETQGSIDRDVGVTLVADDFWTIGFRLNETSIESALEESQAAEFDAGEFHHFVLRSGDMRSYELWIDSQLAMQGSFFYGISAPKVAWGDSRQGATSLAEWDFVRFGVVPEPRSALLLLGGFLMAARISFRRSENFPCVF